MAYKAGLSRRPIPNEAMHNDRASSGISGLDDILGGGGFPRSQMYLVEGDPGAGKTTLGVQFLLAGRKKGESGAYVVLSESGRALRRLADSHGWDLQDIQVIESRGFGPDEDAYSLFHPSEVELGETSRTILNELDRLRPRRIVIDSLSEVRLLAQDPLRYRRQILTLRQFFEERDMTVLMLDFVNEGDDRQLESLCHGIIGLDQVTLEYGGHRRRLRIHKLRESKFRDGYHDFSIETGGLSVYPRLVAAEHRDALDFEAQTTSTGLERLDAVLGGGLDRGTSTLILGPAGSGKSTLAAVCARAAVQRGEKVAFFIFDEVPSTLVVRGEGLGLNVRADIEAGRIALRHINPAEMSPGQFSHDVRQAVDAFGASMVVIDSVNGYHSAMPEEHFLSAHLHELLGYLAQQRIVTIMVMTQAGLVGDAVQSPVDLSYLADTVILLRYFEANSEIRQAISVLKRRTGAHERTIRELRIDRDGVHLGEPLYGFQGIMSGQLVYTGRRPGAERAPDGAGEVATSLGA
jgi:circadian clock protein KaiC